MGHHHHDHSTEKNLGIAFVLNLVFTIIEVIGGIYTNSLAILSDAVHDLGDSLSLGLAWYFEKVSSRPVDLKFTYGYKRFSVLGAIINSIVLSIGSIFILKAAIPRILEPEIAHSEGMMLLAIVGIVFNGLAYWKTHHGHSHNERTVSLHLLEDVLGWVAVLIGAIIMYFTHWYYIDPLLSAGISLYILYNVFSNVKATMNIILQGIPDQINIDHLQSLFLEVDNVLGVHDLHIWTMDGQHNILTAHVVVPQGTGWQEAHHTKSLIQKRLLEANVHHCTLEIERVGDECTVIE